MKSKRFILGVGALFLAGVFYAVVMGWPFAKPDIGFVQDINTESLNVLRAAQGFLAEQRRLAPPAADPGQPPRVSPFVLSRQATVTSPAAGTSTGTAKIGDPKPDRSGPTLTVGTGFSLRVSGTFLSGDAGKAKCSLMDGSVLTVGDRVRGGWTLSAADNAGATFTRNGKSVFCRIGSEVFLEDLPRP